MIVENWSRNWSQREGDAVARMAAFDSVDDEAVAGRAFHAKVVARNRLAREVGSCETRLRDLLETKRTSANALEAAIAKAAAEKTVATLNDPIAGNRLKLSIATRDAMVVQSELTLALATLATFDSLGDAA